MKQSPMAQARRNRYALQEKLRQHLGAAVDTLMVTHAVWFPEITWKAAAPMEIPSRHFLLDRNALKYPESALLALLREAAPSGPAWSRSQQQALKELLAPDCHLLVPLSVQVDSTLKTLHQATEQQMSVLRMLRSQSRLLVEGGAGTGKTLLACMLAREHAAKGKSVLLTCFNKQLANHLAACLADCHNVQVTNFHELVHQLATQAGLPYEIIDDPEQRARFFREGAPELLLNASELLDVRFDTLIVDEAMDFASTWWIALSALGRDNFAWYCFFDRQQAIYQHGSTWEAPFTAAPMQLETNLRNPQPIGEFAAHIAHYPPPAAFRVQSGSQPITYAEGKYCPGTNRRSFPLSDGECEISLAKRFVSSQNLFRYGYPFYRKYPRQYDTGFQGLEADVVILVGIDANAAKHPDWLYIGASRARAALYLLALEEFPDLPE